MRLKKTTFVFGDAFLYFSIYFIAKFRELIPSVMSFLLTYVMREVVAWIYSLNEVLLKRLQNSQENTCAVVSFFDKVAGLQMKTWSTRKLSVRFYLFLCMEWDWVKLPVEFI